MTFEEMVKKLDINAANDIEWHYDSAVSTTHGSGDHWILMSVLDKYGFRTNSPTKAVEIAEEIIILWYHLQK